MAGQPAPIFASPTSLLAPDLAVQQQQIARQQALAQALRENALQDTAGNGGRVSWTQGLARLGNALLANREYSKADKGQAALNQAYSQRLFGGGAFGGGSSQTLGDFAQDNRGSFGSGGVEDNGALPVRAPQPQQEPQQSQQGPLSLTGDPQRDALLYSMAPDEYIKARLAASAPTDFNRSLQQAGIDPNSPLGRQLQQAQLAKQNYIAPVNGRPGSTIRDPFDPSKVIGYDAPNIDGAIPTYGANGMPTGYQQLPGAGAAMQQAAAAKSVGQAAGDLVDVYNPATQQMVKIPKSALLSGAANGGQPFASGPALGASAAADITGKNSANAFQDISNGAADVPNRIYALNQMQQIANDPKSQFGAGSEGLNHFNSVLGTISQSTGIAFDPKAATNANEFQKWATQYSARSGQELGLSGSDARTQLAVHATPNGEMTRQALQSVIPQMVGIENAKQGYANAANVWQQQHGPQTVQQFRTEWNKVYDPAIYTHMAQGPQAFAGWVKSLSPQQAAAARSKYIQLKQIGALPQ